MSTPWMRRAPAARWVVGVAIAVTLAGCGGARAGQTPSHGFDLADLRARAAAHPEDAALRRELAIAELLAPGGDPARVGPALERAEALSANDASLAYVRGLEEESVGHLDAALTSYLRTASLAARGDDAISQALAEAALEVVDDLMDTVPFGVARVTQALDALAADPGRLAAPARHAVAMMRIELAHRRGDPAAVRRLAKEAGCITEWRVAGPFGPRELLGFDERAPAEGRGPLADRYDLGPGRGVRPTRSLEARGCGVNVGAGPVAGPGTTIVEGKLSVSRGGRYAVRLETPNPVELSIDGERVVRLDARREPVARTTYHIIPLDAGDHEVEVKITSRHPNPILVVAVVPAMPGDEARLPEPTGARPLEDFLSATRHILRGDVVSAREVARPYAEARDATTPWLVLRAAIALSDPLSPADVRRDEARRLLRLAVRRDQRLWYPILQTARLESADGQVLEAIAALRDAAERFPEVVGFRFTLADLYRSRGWTADADAQIDRLLEQQPAHCGALRGRYDALRRRDRHAEAYGLIDRLMGCDARSNVRYQQLLDQRRWTEAARELARLQTFEPPQNRVGFLSAHIELAKQQGDEAAVDRLLAELGREMPRSPSVPLEQADRLLAAGDVLGARRHLAAALDADPAAMADLHRVRRAIGGDDALAPWRRDGAAILREFLASGRTYTEPQVLVFDYAATRVFPDGSSMQLVHQIYRVQSDEAVNEHGEFALPAGARILTLHTIKQDGRRLEPDVIAGKDTISLPQLAIGDFVESEYVILEDPSPSFPGGYVGSRFYFRSFEVPFDLTQQVYILPRDQTFVIDPRGPAPTPDERIEGDLRVLTFTMRESRPLAPEPATVAAREFLPSVNVARAADWTAFVDGMRDVLADKDPRDPAAVREVARILGNARGASDEVKARRLHAWVLEHIEDSDAFFGSAPVMLAARTGSRVRVLRYLLSLAGIDSDLVATRSKAADRTESPVADPETYANALLRLRLRDPDGPSRPSRDVWLSVSERFTPFGYVPPLLAGQDGLVIGPGATRVRVPEAPEGSERHEVDVEVTLAADGSARLRVTETYRGSGAIGWRNQLEGVPAAELERRFEEGYVSRLLAGATLESLEIEAARNAEQPLVLRYEFRVADLGRRTGGARAVPGLFPSRLGPRLAPRPSRRLTQLVSSETDERVTIRFRAPAGMLPAAAPAVRLEGPGGARFVAEARRDGETYVIERHVRVPVMRVTPEQYADFAAFCRAADEAESRETSFPMR